MKQDKIVDIFFELLRAGLWEKSARLPADEPLDLPGIQLLAKEQSVTGLVTAGLEHVEGRRVDKQTLVALMGYTLKLEQLNTAMNAFIGGLFGKMDGAGIRAVLLKGQGVAHCYERPLWRECGDIDLFLDDDNYRKAKDFLIPFASQVDTEGFYKKHLGLEIDSWVVELHGTLHCGLSARVDRGLYKIKKETFGGGDTGVWMNGETPVPMLSAVNAAIYSLTHILQHFYKGGIGVRQLCDWCRLLWTNREDIDPYFLEFWLRDMGLVAEWKGFGAFAVEYLGMPSEAMPLYASGNRWKKKAKRIRDFIVEVGNMGHNRDKSYFEKYPYVIRKAISLGRRVGDVYRHVRLFPLDSLRFFTWIVINGLRSAIRGE